MEETRHTMATLRIEPKQGGPCSAAGWPNSYTLSFLKLFCLAS